MEENQEGDELTHVKTAILTVVAVMVVAMAAVGNDDYSGTDAFLGCR